MQSAKFRYIVLTFVSGYDTILVTRGCGRILAGGLLRVWAFLQLFLKEGIYL